MVMGVAAIFGMFAGTYFWFPKMTGRMMNEGLRKRISRSRSSQLLHLYAVSIITAWPECSSLFFVCRRLHGTADAVHKFITIAALCTGAAQLIFLYNLFHSRFCGIPAANPWNGTSLEWSMPSPPPWDNFGGKHPLVYHDPYQYGVKSERAPIS